MVQTALTVPDSISSLDDTGELADLLTRANQILAERLTNGQEVFMVLDDPNQKSAASLTTSMPIYGHVFDDQAEMFSGGVSDGQIW